MTSARRILGVGPGASREEILGAFRMRAQVCHPDKHSTAPDAVQRAAGDLMSVLNEARAALLDSAAETQDIPPLTDDLRITPDTITVRRVTPGVPAVGTVTLHARRPQAEPLEVYGPEPGLVRGTDILEHAGRTARVRIILDTGLLAEHRVYDIDLAVRWGTTVGTVRFVIETTELTTWTEPGSGRVRHRPLPSHGRLRRFALSTIPGLLLPTLAVAWAHALLPLQSVRPSYALATTAVGVALLAGWAWVVVRGRAFRRPDRLTGPAFLVATALLGAGSAASWLLRRPFGRRRAPVRA